MDTEHNQLWKIEGKKDGEEHGVMKLLESGIEGFEDIKLSEPEMLTTFIDLCYEKYPADIYDLIMWDHGMGPAYGFGKDIRGGILSLADMVTALDSSSLIKDGKNFELINFDACLMSNAEVAAALGRFADDLICSSEEMPDAGQSYTNILNEVKKHPAMNGYEIGRFIVDEYGELYTDDFKYGVPCTLSVINCANFNRRMLPLLNELSVLLSEEAETPAADGSHRFWDEVYSHLAAFEYGLGSYDLCDLSGLCAALGCVQNERAGLSAEEIAESRNMYTDVAASLMTVLADDNNSGDDVLHSCCVSVPARTVSNRNIMNADGEFVSRGEEFRLIPKGMSIFFPL